MSAEELTAVPAPRAGSRTGPVAEGRARGASMRSKIALTTLIASPRV